MRRPQPCRRSPALDDTYERAARDAPAMKLLPNPTTTKGTGTFVVDVANNIRAGKSLLYSFPLSPSSSGQGRHPFKVDIAGSNPAGGTTESEKPVALAVTGFLLPICRDSNPTGADPGVSAAKRTPKRPSQTKSRGPRNADPGFQP